MRHYCTLSDKNFLAKGLALYKSLRQHSSEEFELRYLCLDHESFTKIESLKLPGLIPQALSAVEEERHELKDARANRPYNEYCWTLASYYMDYLLSMEGWDGLGYIDSDIIFYGDPKILYDELGDGSAGIIAHRHNAVGDRDGAYNVGFIHFQNDETGKACLRWWADAVLNQKFPELRTCGDQKYLEQFIPLFGGRIRVLDKTFAHGAPWNYRLYCWDELARTGCIRWGDRTQKFLFNHFSRYSYDLQTGNINPTSGQYGDHTLGGTVFNIVPVRDLQVQYFAELKTIHDEWLSPTPVAPAIIKPIKVAFGMIVFNGDYVLQQSLESVYSHAHQILVAEGPVKWWQEQGHTTSTDKTNHILHSFPDPTGKIKVVHGQYSEKDAQCAAYMPFLDPSVDFVWNLDSDEVYKPEDIESIIKLLHDGRYTSAGLTSISFYGGFDRFMTGWEQQRDQFLRVFKVFPGSSWLTHRPPTIQHAPGVPVWPPKHLNSEELFDKTGAYMYHASYVYPRQVHNKVAYYKAALTKHKCIENYFEEVYMPWVSGSLDLKMCIEEKWQGVHEWKPEYRTPTFTTPFTGTLPPALTKALPELKAELLLQRQIYAGL